MNLELNTALQTIDSLEERITKIKADFYTKDNLAVLIGDLFKEYKLDAIVIVGTTPAFNDGDPCTHSSDLYYCEDELNCYFDGFDERYDEYEDHDFLAPVESVSFTVNSILNDLTYQDPMKAEYHKLSGYIMELSDYIYDTNYKIECFVNKDGELEINHDEYYDY